jgi:activator of Hsp90 ATPase-like protein
MSDNDYTAVITVDTSRAEAFDAAVNLRAWWSEEIDGDTDRLGAEFTYNYMDTHRCRMRVMEYVPGRRVAWLVLENHFVFTDGEEWLGTTIEIDVAERDGRTEVRLTHRGLLPQHDCYDVCSKSWDFYVGRSLLAYITTGAGQPNPRGRANLTAEAAVSAA